MKHFSPSCIILPAALIFVAFVLILAGGIWVQAQAPDLEIDKACTGPYVPGEAFGCTYTVMNNGDAPADNVILVDEWLDIDPFVEGMDLDPDWICGADLACSRRAPMPALITETITITYQLPANARAADPDDDGSFDNCIDVSYGVGSSLYQCFGPYAMAPQATLSLDLDNLFSSAAPGATILYQADISNSGPSDIYDVGLDFTEGTNLLPGTVVMGPNADSLYIPVGDSRSVLISVQVDPAAPLGGLVSASADVNTDNVIGTANAPSDSSSVNPFVSDSLPDADVQVLDVRQMTSPMVPGGGTANIEIDVINNGPAAAYGAILTNLFQNASWIITGSSVQGEWNLSGTGGTFTRRTPMPVGVMETLEISLRLPANAHYTAPANLDIRSQIASASPDPTPANNWDEILGMATRADATLTLSKTLLNDGVAPGGTALFEIVVCNNGPSDIDGIAILDTPGVNLGAVTLSSDAANLYLPADQCRDVLAAAPVLGTAQPGNAFGNSASVDASGAVQGLGATQPASVSTPPPASDGGTVGQGQPNADVEVLEIRQMTDPMVPGGTSNIEVDVINNGPGLANGAVVSNLLRDSEWIVDGTSSTADWNITSTGGVFTRRTPMPVAITETLLIGIRLPSDAHYTAPDNIDFVAMIASANPDPVSGNNWREIFGLETQADADLTLTKTLLNDGVAPGGTAFYEIVTCNDGPSDLSGIDVLDAPGSGLDAASLVLSTDAGGIYLPAGECRDYLATVALTTTAAVGDPFINTAEISDTFVYGGPGSTMDPLIGLPPPATATGAVGSYLPDADMDATSTILPLNAPVAGEIYSYEIYVDNLGPAPAEGAVVHHSLVGVPGGWQVTDVITNLPWACDGGGQTCTRAGSMPVGHELVARFDILLPADLIIHGSGAPEGLFSHELVVTAHNPDPDLVNNAVSLAANATGEATLEVLKSDYIDPVPQGENILYEIVVSNQGPSTLPQDVVEVFDDLDERLVFLGASPECHVDPLGESVTCVVPDEMDPGESYDFMLQVEVPYEVQPGAVLTNTATADAPNLDDNVWTITPGSDLEETLVTGGYAADLRITKFGKPDGEVRAGENLTYTIVVENLGPSTASSVIVRDLIKSSGSFELLSVESDRPAVCAPLSGVFNQELKLECSLNNDLEAISPDTSGRWIITLVVSANEGQDINNLARVLSNTFDPDLDNNQALVLHEITKVGDLALVKEAVGWTMGPDGSVQALEDQVTAGLSLTYTLTVTNNGPSTAVNIVLYDVLPDWLEVSAVSPSQGACAGDVTSELPERLRCPLGHLAPGTSATVWITAFVPADLPSGLILINEALVVSDAFDPYNGDNIATNQTTVNAWADLSLRVTQSPVIGLVGDKIVYTLTIKNSGPSDALGARVFDMQPAGLSDVTWACTPLAGADCQASGSGELDETVDLPVGGKLVYTVSGTVASLGAGGELVYRADVLPPAGVLDPDVTNNQDSVSNLPLQIFLPMVFK